MALQGIFVIAGPTGVGKSTLAAAEVVGPDFPGVYFESENTFRVDGEIDSFAFSRFQHSYGNDDARFEHLSHTTNFEEAKAQLQRLAKGFLVVDTIQGTTKAEDHDWNLDAGVLHSLERTSKEPIALADAGYAILAVSQTNDRHSKQPPALGALKGASALEQMAWTVVGYGISKTDDEHTRTAVLRKLRRPTAPGYPVGSPVVIRTDGQDGLTEVGLAAAAAPAAKKRRS